MESPTDTPANSKVCPDVTDGDRLCLNVQTAQKKTSQTSQARAPSSVLGLRTAALRDSKTSRPLNRDR